MPAQDVQDEHGFVGCHLLWSDFPTFMDLLRNERPLFLRYMDNASMASLTTSPEPVGENE